MIETLPVKNEKAKEPQHCCPRCPPPIVSPLLPRVIFYTDVEEAKPLIDYEYSLFSLFGIDFFKGWNNIGKSWEKPPKLGTKISLDADMMMQVGDISYSATGREIYVRLMKFSETNQPQDQSNQ